MVNQTPDNRGTYVLNVARNLPCLPTVRREREKFGENSRHKSYVLNQLPKVDRTYIGTQRYEL